MCAYETTTDSDGSDLFWFVLDAEGSRCLIIAGWDSEPVLSIIGGTRIVACPCMSKASLPSIDQIHIQVQVSGSSQPVMKPPAADKVVLASTAVVQMRSAMCACVKQASIIVCLSKHWHGLTGNVLVHRTHKMGLHVSSAGCCQDHWYRPPVAQ